jgi:hypothetical protein
VHLEVFLLQVRMVGNPNHLLSTVPGHPGCSLVLMLCAAAQARLEQCLDDALADDLANHRVTRRSTDVHKTL